MSHIIRRITLSVATMLLAGAAGVFALEPPTAEQLERYRSDGTLAARVDAAKSFGNHRMAARLAARAFPQAVTKALPDAPTVLPSEGSRQVLTLLIAFEDMLGYTDPAVVHERIYGEGDPASYPTESLTSFYRRSSYDRLEITGSTLGWYTTPYPRADVVESYSGRQELIKEVITHFDTEGHDFSQYDNDGDGYIDYFVIVWTGAHGEWAEFWWGYQTSFWNDDFTVDGVQLSTYSWQWENYNWPGEFSPEVLIHETGHALGLPDYYDYDDAVGPRGGVGGLDQMAGNWGDHNVYSKWVLGWLEPEIYNQDSHQLMLAPNDDIPQAAVLMHGDPVQDPFAEYFLVQHRRREGNDAQFPNDGLLIWHVDARLGDDGYPLYDNSYSEHKLLRLMEADGLEEIEMGGRADAGDFFVPGDLFDNDTSPNANRYDGVATNIAIASVLEAGSNLSLQADLGSGCALWCDSTVSPNAWPGVTVAFNGSLDTANCEGVDSYGWIFGDGASSGDTSASHAYVSTGDWNWSVEATLEDAICAHNGTINVCTDFSCWQWSAAQSMTMEKYLHATVPLDDGGVFAVGGFSDPEIYDPGTDTWSPAAPTETRMTFTRAERLSDGRVFVVGMDESGEIHADIYDPVANTWTTTGQPNHPRIVYSIAVLSDGRVLLVGGFSGEYPHQESVEDVEIWDPNTENWTVADTLPGLRIQPGIAPLNDGRLLIVGGRQATIFDPLTDTFTRATPLPDEWSWPVAVTLDNGRVLMSGVANGGMTLLWNPADGRLSIGGRHQAFREGATATKLPNGYVLIAGGIGSAGSGLDSTEFFDPATLQWSTGSSLAEARGFHAATLLNDGRLLLTGGAKGQGPGYGTLTYTEVLTQPTTPPRSIGGRISP